MLGISAEPVLVCVRVEARRRSARLSPSNDSANLAVLQRSCQTGLCCAAGISLRIAKSAEEAIFQRVQTPKVGAFSSDDLEWAQVAVRNAPDKPVFEALIPLKRVEDFIAGEQLRGPSRFCKKGLKKNPPGSLAHPHLLSFLHSQDYRCQYGPEDHRVAEPIISDPSRPTRGKGKVILLYTSCLQGSAMYRKTY